MAREWKGWGAVNCPNQSKLTQSWCQKFKTGKPTLTPSVTENHVVVTIIEYICESQSSPTIHYTYNEKLEGLRCCEIFESIQTYTILVWHVGASYRNCHHPWLKNRGVPLVVGRGWWIQISTLQNHLLYSWSENRRVEMLWIAQISPNLLNLGVKSGMQESQLWPHPWLKTMLLWPL